jgi:hypothetical protein
MSFATCWQGYRRLIGERVWTAQIFWREDFRDIIPHNKSQMFLLAKDKAHCSSFLAMS